MLKDWKTYFSLTLGAAAGVVIFLALVTFLVGDPLSDWFSSAHGVFVAEKEKELSFEQKLQLYELVRSGVIVTADGLLSHITSLYGNIIQALIGLFVIFGVLSFFGLRWHSKQLMEEAVTNSVANTVSNYTSSLVFDGLLTVKVQHIASTEIEDLETRISVVGELDERVSILEGLISNQDDSDQAMEKASQDEMINNVAEDQLDKE